MKSLYFIFQTVIEKNIIITVVCEMTEKDIFLELKLSSVN